MKIKVEYNEFDQTENVEVNERVKYFVKEYVGWSIETEMLSNENGVCIFKAVIRDGDGMMRATGHAYEKEDSSFINKTSYIENCETSAVGRALGFLGIGIDTSIASGEEVTNAVNNQPQSSTNKTYKNEGRLDFDQLKARLEQLTTIEEIEAAKEKLFEKFPKMSDKQKRAVYAIFATRIDYLDFGEKFGMKEVKGDKEDGVGR